MIDSNQDRTHDYHRLEEVSPAFLLKTRVLRDLLRELFPAPVARAWDAGCGAGTLSLLLVDHTREELLVTDIEQTSVALTLERLGRRRNIKITGQAVNLEIGPAPPGPFDLILCWAVLEHLGEDQLGLRLLAGALAPHGRLILNVPLHPRLMNALDRLEHHHRRYTPQGLVSLLGGAGLRLEQFRFFGFPALLFTKVLWAPFVRSERRVTESDTARRLAGALAAVDHAFYRARFPWGVEGLVVAAPESHR